MADDPTTEAVPEVRCYGHVFDPAHQHGPHEMGHDGWPAHTWGAGSDHLPGCVRCIRPFENGDRYVCVRNGAMHTTCVADFDAALLTEGDDRG